MQLLNKNERELVKLASFFIKNTERLIEEGTLGEEHQKVVATCQTLIEKIHTHSNYRDEINKTRENLKHIIRDNASCPKCNTNNMLKLVGVDTEEKWKCNRYKCRRCNIHFTWNRPNNPWDMVPFTEALVQDLEHKLQAQNVPEEVKQQTIGSLDEMKMNLQRIRDVVEGADQEFKEMQERDLEMSKLVHEFKNYLLIEKIKMDKWKGPEED